MTEHHASCLDCDWTAHHDDVSELKDAATMHELLPGHRPGVEPCGCEETGALSTE